MALIDGVWVKGTLPDGVDLKRCDVFLDRRGWLVEWLDETKLGALSVRWVYTSIAYPGQERAGHYHLKRTEYWMVIGGEAEVELFDLREDSPTFEAHCTFCMGDVCPARLVIPPRVAHVFRALGITEARLLVCATECYNPDDNLPYDFGGLLKSLSEK